MYTNKLSTLCPLPWLEEAEDVQYNFDDVYIPLHTIDIYIQQMTRDLPRSSDKRHRKRKSVDLSQSSTGDMPESSGGRDDQRKTGDLSDLLETMGFDHQTRYKYNKFIVHKY